jgi:hypothetical protein
MTMINAQDVFITRAQQQGQPINGEELSRRINDAIERAVNQADQAQQSVEARQGLQETIAQLRAEIEAARAQGIREIRVEPNFQDTIPPQAVDISVAFFAMLAFIIVGLPLARAFARRMDRKGESAASASDVAPRLDRIEQAIEAVAIEVERVSEGQRYTTKAISELRGLPSSNPIGAWPGNAREAAPVPAESTRRP